MAKLFILGFLCISILAVHGADEVSSDVSEDENCVVTIRKTKTNPGFLSDKVYEIFVTPDTFRRFNDYFHNSLFWTSKVPLNPNAIVISYPRLLLQTPDSTLLDQHFKKILSDKPISENITQLSNQLLKIYASKNPDNFSPSFNLIYLYDQNILHEVLYSFLRIISTPDPNRAKGYEWKTQTFVRVFSHLCNSLNVEEADTVLNLEMRKIIAIALGLSSLNYEKWFKCQYPALAKWLKSCAPNKSRKPIYTVFTFSLMDTLTPKISAPFALQITMENTAPKDNFILPPPMKKEEIPLAPVKVQTPAQKVSFSNGIKPSSAFAVPIPQSGKKARSMIRNALTSLKESSKAGSHTSADFGSYFNSAQQHLTNQPSN